MPKIRLKPKQPEPAKATPPLAEFGLAVALADLAETCGMRVEHVLTLPAKLAEAGLPQADGIAHWVRRLAHDIDRDRADALLYRVHQPSHWNSGRSLINGTDGPTVQEAKAQAEAARKAKAESEAKLLREQRRQAAVRDDRRNEALRTPEEAVAALQPLSAKPLQAKRAF